jgi:hypothetical protein
MTLSRALLWQLLAETTLCARKRDFRGTSISEFFNNIRKQRSLPTAPRTGQIDPKRSVTRTDKLELSTRDLRDSVGLDQEVCPSCCNRFRDEDRSITNKPAASPTLTAAEATKTPIAACTPPVSIKAVPIDGAAA